MIFSAFIALFFCLVSGTGDVWAGALQTDTVTVSVKGSGTGTDARFEPAVVQVQPGDLIKFSVMEGLHTVTAYHPNNRRPLRIPENAEPFDSGLLKPGDSWYLEIKSEGVYDYFCLPHERMGHAGRIVSGSAESIPDYETGPIPEAALHKINSETKIFLTNKYQLIPNRK